MEEKKAMVNGGTVQGSAREFVAYYQSEIKRQVNNMRNLIDQLRMDPDNRAFLEEIRTASRSIADLAMVYGFEGVEVIADRIEHAVIRLAEKDISDEFLARLKEAAGAVEKTMILIDECREREIVRELSRKTFDPESFSYVEAAGETGTPDEGASETDFHFDIKEDEKLISILSDVDDEPYEIENKNFSKEKEEKEPKTVPDFKPVDSSELSFAFEGEPEESIQMSDASIDEAVLEIDFQKMEPKIEKKSEGFFHKIGKLFGSKSEKHETAEHSQV
ncbi:hypothetical protein BMS3Abin05_02003 [bacterium BMS3Abin05]|nr:hypothetical protein BMS3Abin05_02003 [bacterium BMS3Abin05]GBE27586.1 hypothetical protein BMS3Bbin03_01514 [bacterium BMS3Bbin03]